MENKLEGSENDFSGSADEWEQRVFLHASHFRLHRFHGRGGRDEAKVDTFPEAVATALAGLEGMTNSRVLLYAVTESGRHVCIPQKRWLDYLRLWDATRASA